jgi:hypothetical protein
MARTLQVESINSSLTGLDLTTAGVSRLFITNSGNVGINTISASSLFEVNGDITISDKIIHAGDTNTFIRFVTSDAVSIDTAGSERFRITPNGGIAFGGAANYGTTAHVLKSAGDTAPVWGFVTNANVDSSAAIAYSKLSLGTSIVNTDISASAAIVDTKLATISTALKVSNSATTATNANTASAIVARDASGNFSAGTITATTFSGALTGNVTGNTSGSSGSCTGNSATVTDGVYLSTAQSVTGRKTFNANLSSGSVLNASGSLGAIEIQNTGTGNGAFLAFHRPSAYASYFGLDTDNNFAVGGWSAGAALGLMKVGSFGVGTASSGTAGEIRATNNITAYYSDERLKNFIGKISNALEKVNSLNGYYYKENSKAKELGYNNDSLQVGISAQEVEKILPEIVTLAPIDCATDSAGKTISKTGENYKTVYYEKLIPLLIEAIKELSLEIEKLKHK